MTFQSLKHGPGKGDGGDPRRLALTGQSKDKAMPQKSISEIVYDIIRPWDLVTAQVVSKEKENQHGLFVDIVVNTSFFSTVPEDKTLIVKRKPVVNAGFDSVILELIEHPDLDGVEVLEVRKGLRQVIDSFISGVLDRRLAAMANDAVISQAKTNANGSMVMARANDAYRSAMALQDAIKEQDLYHSIQMAKKAQEHSKESLRVIKAALASAEKAYRRSSSVLQAMSDKLTMYPTPEPNPRKVIVSTPSDLVNSGKVYFVFAIKHPDTIDIDIEFFSKDHRDIDDFSDMLLSSPHVSTSYNEESVIKKWIARAILSENYDHLTWVDWPEVRSWALMVFLTA